MVLKLLSFLCLSHSDFLLNQLKGQTRRVNDYYIPTYKFLKEMVMKHKEKNIENENDVNNQKNMQKRPCMIGISAAQGCGKTTLVEYMKELFERDDLKCAVMSLDDFYLTRSDQIKLSIDYDKNPLFKFRGNAGSHDLPLLMNTMQKFVNIYDTNIIKVPRYNKLLHDGLGDRDIESNWEVISDPSDIDVVLFEGWMLGFQAIDDEEIQQIENTSRDSLVSPPLYPQPVNMTGISQVNQKLKAYKALHELFDGWLVLAPEDISYVFQWRLDAERANFGDDGLSDEQIQDFVNQYMPAYRAYAKRAYGFYPDEDTTQHKKGESEMKDQQTDANMNDDVGPERPKGTPVKVLHIGRDRLPLP